MKKILYFLLVLLLLILTSCQMTFYLEDGWGKSTHGATELDKSLIFHQEGLRKAYKNGELSSAQGLTESGPVKYVLQVEENKFYVTFFGTDNVTEAYYDMIHWKEPFWTNIDAGIGVHAGFNRPLQEIFPAIQTELETFLITYPNRVDREIYILGHSAGGVHAVLCAFSLKCAIPALENGEIYCQIGGAPAPGNSSFARAFDKRITCHRYINGSDMMPSLLTPEMGYEHVGQAYRIGPDPNPVICSTGLWLRDHFIGDYADSLR